ncbi:PAS domain S-box protein [Ktedonobacter sp. SOSP1-52]|uniref:PAS domain S-box protein n=1 Tax=Ktedonobacter sp. SOSP1-52 TaxID=2778366 RepID=UPI0019160412|nr:PAS domain S-box protein [Ktedonobacter sp. SOSP1-52]
MRRAYHSDKQAVAKAFERVTTAPGLSTKAQYSITQADGTTRWLEETYVNRLNVPDLAAIVATLRDITEQKQAERERETRLQEREDVLAQNAADTDRRSTPAGVQSPRAYYCGSPPAP